MDQQQQITTTITNYSDYNINNSILLINDHDMNNSSSSHYTPLETFNRMKCRDEISSLITDYVQLENLIKSSSSNNNNTSSSDTSAIEELKQSCLEKLNLYSYNTTVLLSSLSEDYDEQLNEIDQRLQHFKSEISNYKQIKIPNLNSQLEVEKKQKQFNEQYNLIAELILKKQSTLELKQEKHLAQQELNRLVNETGEKQQKIKFYEKQLQLLFIASNDLLSTFK